jgi:dephospho-CoA kinase
LVRLGLTGGIGSGKSTVANIFSRLGAHLIDADAISRMLTSYNGAAIAALAKEFGAWILGGDGALDREKMRQLAFADSTAKKSLEGILHPLVGHEIERQALAAQQAGATCVVFDIPLLVESKHWRAILSRILVVDCSEEIQIQRVMARNGRARSDVEKIISAQASRSKRLAAADLVLFNEGLTLDVLEGQVRKIGAQFGL